MKELTGRIHSFESCGTVDGPGLRFVIFMQGCPLRCLYCHNPDSWNAAEGRAVTLDEVFGEIAKYRSFMKFSGGGVTVSGGEPLLQGRFVAELFKRCRQENIHTALDTSGAVPPEKCRAVYEQTDLVLLDVKAANKILYKMITGASIEPVIATLDYLQEIDKKLWVRHVLLPNFTDSEDALHQLGELLSQYRNIELVELLPFHKIGEFKWRELGIDYQLHDTKPPSPETVEQACRILSSYKLAVRS